MNAIEKQTLLSHLQTAIEIELSTIPIYLYTYYSINRMPDGCDAYTGEAGVLETFANKAGGLIMSVAVEEMLHMSLACNILRSLGGQPAIYGHSPGAFPTNLPHHKAGFSVGLSKLSAAQLDKFLAIEKPEPRHAIPEGDNWETIGQFYDFITTLIEKTTDEDYGQENQQLSNKNGYYAANNVDTIYPKNAKYIEQPLDPKRPWARGADQAQYPNNEESGELMVVRDRKSAIKAINAIKHQGEGYADDPTHKADDPEKNEESHWYKYQELKKEILKLEPGQLGCFTFNFPDNPKMANYPANVQPLVKLANAVYSYLLLLTEQSFKLSGAAQHTLFYIGMHKGMIFILDKIIGGMRYNALNDAEKHMLAPTFEFYPFASPTTAKRELIALCEAVPPGLGLDALILQRIKDLPEAYVGANNMVHF